MGRGDLPPLRSLPRLFIPGADPAGEIELPSEEVNKLRKVLRLSPGAIIAVLPNDGTLIRCEFQAKTATPIDVHHPDVEPQLHLRVAQSLPKGEKLDEIVRACTEIGVSSFTLFSSDRTVVRWDEKKTTEKLKRLQTIAREAAEVSFRTRIPTLEWSTNLKSVLKTYPNALVLSESEGLQTHLTTKLPNLQSISNPRSELQNLQSEIRNLKSEITLIVGPEGGWSPKEMEMIGTSGVTLGPRVLRVDHAAAAAAALLLLS